jgi:hypothetical protein
MQFSVLSKINPNRLCKVSFYRRLTTNPERGRLF